MLHDGDSDPYRFSPSQAFRSGSPCRRAAGVAVGNVVQGVGAGRRRRTFALANGAMTWANIARGRSAVTRVTGTGGRGRTGHGVKDLRARLRAGQPAAFGQIFDAHARVVYRHALRVTGDWALAEDVMSLTFLEAWRLRQRLRSDAEDEEDVRPWLMGLATNVLRNTTRAARRHRAALGRLPPRQAQPDIAEEVTSRLADQAQLSAARAALSKLRRSDREVFTLCVWSGLDYAAAAEALGVPVGTVRSRLSRARSRLQQIAAAELASGRHDARQQPAPPHGLPSGGLLPPLPEGQ